MTPAHNAPRLLVEPFAGMAALSFGCMGAKPPISWMGGKAGYIRVLMELLGLSRYNPPAAYVWGDVGPNVAALATLAGARGDARDVAGWLWATRRQFPGSEAFRPATEQTTETANGGNTYSSDSPAPALDALPLPRAAEVAAIIRGWKDEEPRALWTRLKAAGWPSLMPVEGGRWLGPARVEEVAGYILKSTWSYEAGNAATGFCGPGDRRQDTSAVAVAVAVDRIGEVKWPRVACYQGTATRLVEQLPADLSGVLVYADGPYHGDGSRKITGYRFGGCSREEQLALVADCHRRGARVAMSESVPLAAELRALTGDEWWPVDITEHREGQARTFGGTSEYVTLNRPPLHTRGAQQRLFGGSR